MQYTYRGTSYTIFSQLIDSIETKTSAKYRGTSYRIRRPIDSPIAPQHNLMYRGVAYYPQAEREEMETIPVFG
jgi:hypothetical protein